MDPRQLSRVDTLIYAVYYAPRGRYRLYMVASEIARRYLTPTDYLIGIIGEEGSGKSTLIRGLFPGLELTNEDEGINVSRAPIYSFSPEDYFSGHTFHVDIRHELAFTQKYKIKEAIRRAVEHQRRVVVEHFDLIYDILGLNAQVLIGIGEEIIVARPTVFGPFPNNIKAIIDRTIKYRLMAHSAEDITTAILEKDYHYQPRSPLIHSDIRHGFVINFPERPDIDLDELEDKVKEVIAANVPISPCGEDNIVIGEMKIYCTGPRTHVHSSGEIENFRLLKEFRLNPLNGEFMLIGMVGQKTIAGFEDIIEYMDIED
ncbi:MAG: alanine-tRNA synthetase second additional domain-containing protein [Acidobacteriota bacterium]|nr:alanine-tRNA synthetase second additional domain-containing protein [Acidobacteriota bacterium]MDW3228995.1 alanine-tRNA synthetase second additional domain-containing protein [Acidobacteriota bacterium]MDY0230969.1 alanine-tRNA synthetase second additional domain-containing protein [Candidatus Saccharicenans sp.]